MRRPGQYGDSAINQMVAAQMQHAQAQRNSGMGHYPGRADSVQADEGHQYMSSKAEGQWQWDRDGVKGSNVPSSHMYKEGQGREVPRSSYQGQRPDPELGLEKQGNKDPRTQARQDDMEVGYEDNILPQTFEGLEQKFIQDIMKLTKEHQDAEDIENARHRERLSEINIQYQEKLLAVRARQATRREELLRKESESRHQQYQSHVNSYQNLAGPSDAHGFGSSANHAAALSDAHRAYAAAGNFEPYGERAEFGGGLRGRGYEPRGRYPGGRAYNSGGRNF
ncbi:uncharacterized protein A4U43_C05F16510 [Asparagus officinalis]|uniref:Uncharacterized protein n=1 Tax=Asparagus officinalis TaxID=4686 RepID=A0A5P1ES16_ASPOF|nr:uncharacterized protein LOC109843858 [Asparagus officinalis]XP_020268406.1 uncharacterized protein LOC109843858 [Asparagus officinalis]XP_020268407.1 uncharacterized protein LOC109843858 [Asparagus officinalis]ONK68835.1 uncharacterized protein A4U43_C05F16510 [Asparagus officinalis]